VKWRFGRTIHASVFWACHRLLIFVIDVLNRMESLYSHSWLNKCVRNVLVIYLTFLLTIFIVVVCHLWALAVHLHNWSNLNLCVLKPVLLFSRARSKGWPHHGRIFTIYLCPLLFWLTPSWGVLSTYWCCPSRPCVVFLACMHLALFLALSLSPGNSLAFSWCDHSMLASLLWQNVIVPSLLQLCSESTHLFSLHFTKSAEFFSAQVSSQ